MGSDDAEARRETRTVEIGSAVALGGLTAIVPSVVLWPVGPLVHSGGPGWESVSRTALQLSVVAGAAVAIWWLLRARRRGDRAGAAEAASTNGVRRGGVRRHAVITVCGGWWLTIIIRGCRRLRDRPWTPAAGDRQP